MSPIDKIVSVQSDFVEGKIPLDELLLHVEPILVDSAPNRAGQDEAKRIVNDIERAIYTKNEPARTAAISKF